MALAASLALAPGLGLAPGLAMTLASCQQPRKLALKDSEGRRFLASCQRDQVCRLEQVSGQRVRPDAKLELDDRGWLVAVCEGADAAPELCRPLLCHSDDDCPAYQRLPHGHCLEGLCARPDHALTQRDAVMLCLAGTGLGASGQLQLERKALALRCGTPCRIPGPCRQPHPTPAKR